MKALILSILLLPIALAEVQVQYSCDANQTWRNVSFLSLSNQEAMQFVEQDKDCCFRGKNSTSDWGYVCQTSKEGLDMIWVLGVILAPILIAFFFIYLSNSLNKEWEGVKWLFRFLAFAMLFPLAIAIDIVANASNSRFPGLAALLKVEWITWGFFFFFAMFLIFFLIRLFTAFKFKKEDDFDQGIIR